MIVNTLAPPPTIPLTHQNNFTPNRLTAGDLPEECKWIIDRLENAVGEEMANNIKVEMILNPDNVGSYLVHVSPDGTVDIIKLIDGVKQ